MMDDLFDEGGPLAQNIDGYRLRQGQIDMAKTIAGNHGLQVLEAGTGIGKTFAYLAPIIQLRLSAIVSTGTRALQSQLFERDIPFLTAALKRPVQVAMLKGRANYICRRNIADPTQSQLFEDDNGDWAKIVLFANKSEDGDISTAANISANSPAWAAAVSTRETCTVQECEFYDNCFLYRARARAHQSDIVVVNHHLFLADMRLREESIAELLPKRDMVVFDEAHLLPSLAPTYFGESLSIAEMLRILTAIDREAQRREIPTTITAMAKKLRSAIGALIDSSEKFSGGEYSAATVAAQTVLDNKEWRKKVERLQKTLNEMRDVAISEITITPQDKSEWVSTIAAQIATAAHKLQRWFNLANNIDDDANDEEENDNDDEPKIPSVCWLHIGGRRGGLTLHSAPVSGRKIFRRAWQNSKNIIMTSATLTIDNEFKNFVQETGMEDAHAESWASPFDYAKRSMLYLPPDLPNPNDRDYTESVIRAVVPLARANHGRAFILFSSLRAMRKGAELLTTQLGKDYKILMQGDAPNNVLLEEFRQTPMAILVGSLSFWQGVDVRGGALSLVVADKIPFIPPDDPLLVARDTWRKKCGEDAFMQNQLPPAAILMKQVAGRLMRDFDDWGVFVACDPRLSSRGYGKIILNSLPPMKKTTDEKTVCDFLQSMRDKEK